MKKIIKNEKDFVIRELDGEMIFINFRDGCSHVLDDVATVIYKTLLETQEKEEAVLILMNIFNDVSKEQLTEDVNNVFEELATKNIIIEDEIA